MRREYTPSLEPGRPSTERYMSTGLAYQSINKWNQQWQLRIPIVLSFILSIISVTV